MVCIYCNGNTSVINSRLQKRHNSVWRRRKCAECYAVFTSIETIDLEQSLLVIKQSGHPQAFSRDKLLISIYNSLKHRKTAIADATALTNTIIGRMFGKVSTPTITVSDLAEIVLSVLDNFDSVASVHYRAYYT